MLWPILARTPGLSRPRPPRSDDPANDKCNLQHDQGALDPHLGLEEDDQHPRHDEGEAGGQEADEQRFHAYPPLPAPATCPINPLASPR